MEELDIQTNFNEDTIEDMLESVEIENVYDENDKTE